MNGTELEVLCIEIDVEDRVRLDYLKDEETNLMILRNMPPSVLVRAIGAQWVLPAEQLPVLPESFDKRGVFLVRPQTSHRCRHKHNDFTYGFRRTQLPFVPAMTRGMYGARGHSFPSLIADLKLAPGQDVHVFWSAVYDMLARAKNIDGLLLLRLPERSQLAAGPPRVVKIDMDRLADLYHSTCIRLKEDLTHLLGELPADVDGLFQNEVAQMRVEGAVDWPAVHRLLAEALQKRLNPATSWSVRTDDRGDCLYSPLRRVRRKMSPFASPGSAASPT